MKYCIFDTETTGLEVGSRMVELAATVLNDQGEVEHSFASLVNPEMPIPADVTAIHGITDADVKDAPTAEKVLRDFYYWLHDTTGCDVTLVAHNAPYDAGILSWAFGHYRLTWPGFPLLDTKALAKSQGHKDNHLSTLVAHYNIPRIGMAHRAVSDVDATRQLFNILRAAKVDLTPAPWPSREVYTADLPPHLLDLPELVAEGKRMEFAYTDKDGTTTERTITPYGWGLTQQGLMIHGWCELRQARRNFYADKMALTEVPRKELHQ